MASLPSVPSARAARENKRAILLAILGLLLVAGAAFLSHRWNSHSGLNVVYVLLALVILTLAFPFTREWLANATNVKLPGGLEVSRQLEDATETVQMLPTVDEDTEHAGEEALKVIDLEWQENPSAALKKLRAELRKKIARIYEEIYPDSTRPRTAAAINQLEEDRLISPQQGRVAKAVLRASGRMVARSFDDDETHDQVVKFMEGADRVTHQIQLIAMDRKIRQELRRKGFHLLDFHGQPPGRWPDFYACHPNHADKQPLRIACRIARNPHSELVDETRARMKRKPEETPLDGSIRRVIVVPNTSRTKWEDDEEIPAMKRDEFFAWVDRGHPVPSSTPEGATLSALAREA